MTDKIDFPEERNYPASIVGAPAATFPIDRVSIVSAASSGADAGTRELTFDVLIRDPNIDDVLQARVFGDLRLGQALQVASSRELSRPFQFRVPLTDFNQPNPTDMFGTCHKIELLVSTAFQENRTPVDPDDLAVAVWWIGLVSDPQQVVDLKTCPK